MNIEQRADSPPHFTDSMLSQQLDEIASHCSFDWIFIGSLLRTGNYVQPFCCAGESALEIRTGLIEETGIIRAALKERLVHSTKTQGWWLSSAANAKKKNRTNVVVVPALFGGVSVGVVCAGRKNPQSFDEQTRENLIRIAGVAAIEIELSRLLVGTRKIATAEFRAESEIALAAVTAHFICDVLAVPASAVCIIDEDRRTLHMLSVHGLNNLSIPEQDAHRTIEQSVRRELQLSELPLNSWRFPPTADFSTTSPSTISVLTTTHRSPGGALFAICACAERSNAFSTIDTILAKGIANSFSQAIDSMHLDLRLRESHENLLTMAQLANAGMIALSFVHDGKHALHQLNALVTSLIYLLPDRVRETQPGIEIVRSVEKQARYLSELLTGLQSVARSRDWGVYVISVRDLLEHVSSLLNLRLASVNLQLPRSMMDESFECYPHQITQVFINLLTNSIDAIRAAGRKHGLIEIQVRLPSTEIIEFSITDNGIGIPTDNIKNVFEPTFTTKGSHRLGFGLSICKRIVENNHGGTLHIRSRQGEFTKVTICLPRVVSQAHAVENNQA